MTVTQQPTLVPTLDTAWRLYVDLFREIDELAAQRHLMTYNEFVGVYHNPDILKFYSYDDAGELIGMSVLTRELEAWPLISTSFFARRFPELYKRKAIWYVGFVGARPGQLWGFRDLVTRMYPYVKRSGGVAVMDFCTYNTSVRRLPAVTQRLLSSINPAVGTDIVDTQSFVLYDFGQAAVGA